MPTSHISWPYNPTNDHKVPAGVLGYVRARARHQLFNLIVSAFKESGISQAQLAKRTGKPPETICRVLSRPRNLEIDTAADILFAINGSLLRFVAVSTPTNAVVRDDGYGVAPITTTVRQSSTRGIADIWQQRAA